MTVQPADIHALAEFFRVCERTIRRWLAQGIDVHDPVQVAQHLAAQHHAADEPLDAVIDQLQAELKTISDESND